MTAEYRTKKLVRMRLIFFLFLLSRIIFGDQICLDNKYCVDGDSGKILGHEVEFHRGGPNVGIFQFDDGDVSVLIAEQDFTREFAAV